MALAFRILLLLFLVVPTAWAGNVVVLLSENSGPYSEFGATFRNALEGSSWKVSGLGTLEQVEESIAHADLVVVAGSAALTQIAAHDNPPPIIATLIPRQAYEKLVRDNTGRNRRMTAIFLDQPAGRQAAFLRHLLPGKSRIGMLLSRDNQPLAGAFRQALGTVGLSLDTEDSEGDRRLLGTLNTLLSRVNILLATPDIHIYNRDNIKAILMTTYRYQRPVVAFSPAFVNAGALAALYSTPSQIALQSAGLIREFGITLPPPMYPSQFAIQINQNVAQALDLNVMDEADLRRVMLADKEAR